MLFDIVLGIRENPQNMPINKRKAVRAIVLKNDYLLMCRTNKGDFKLPGGGVNKDESLIKACKREVLEETGYTCNKTSNILGIVRQRNNDYMNPDMLFEMENFYFAARVSDTAVAQNLDKYEQDMGFTAVWINIDEAIKNNKKCLETQPNCNIWVERELKVFEIIKRYLNKIESIFY